MMKVALILLITFFVLNSHAGKNDKKHDKQKVTKPSSNHHNRNTTPSHHNHQNSTNLHQNHTSSHQSHQNQSDSHAVNPENIGWSLNSNNQAQHHNNPNGYALHSHEGSHHSQHSQMHPQHHDIQSSHQHQQQIQPVQQQNQGSGIGGTLLGAGVGMASGALGGYLLANALNSGGSAEKISEHQTTIEAETTIQNAIATDQSTIAALEQSGSEVTTSNTINEINSISTNEVSQISEAISIEQSTTIAQEIQTSTQITKENNHAVGLKISLNIIIFCTLFLIFSE